MIIKNFQELASSFSKKVGLEIVEAGIKGVLPQKLVSGALCWDGKVLKIRRNRFPVNGRIFVVGFGKASGNMGCSVEKILGEKITYGVINTWKKYPLKRIKVNRVSHPVPDLRGLEGAKEILSLKNEYHIGKNDTVVCLISGGGSAMCPLPWEGLTLKMKQKVTELLLKSGANIQEINTVRKHISKIKGGRLAKHFYPARVISLIISDVMGNDLGSIASGPTHADPTTFQDACRILKKYKLWNKIPKPVQNHIKNGILGKVPETPKTLKKVKNIIIGDNFSGIQEMAKKAEELGLYARVLDKNLQGEARETAKEFCEKIRKIKKSGVYLAGGETTVKLPKIHGKGGRNQEFVSWCLLFLRDLEGEWSLLSVASDGVDFISEAAGGIIDNTSWKEVKRKKINLKEFLKKHDSYHLLKKINSLVRTGYTGTNVCDWIVFVRV
ncbi:MAG: glycerate kinase [Candidatus Aenigmatarchaeota archaeon]|nr:MAG: glycerate kinase [Candidatus Aenigmarchaeota archaeon]